MLVCDTFEELPAEIRARVRLEDPTLACVRYWGGDVTPRCPYMTDDHAEGLLLVDMLDEHAPSTTGWVGGAAVRVQHLAVWASTGRVWDALSCVAWIEPHNVRFVEP